MRYAGKYQRETNKKQPRSHGIDATNTPQTGNLEKLWMLVIRKCTAVQPENWRGSLDDDTATRRKRATP